MNAQVSDAHGSNSCGSLLARASWLSPPFSDHFPLKLTKRVHIVHFTDEIHQFQAIAHINSDIRLVARAQTVKSSASMQNTGSLQDSHFRKLEDFSNLLFLHKY